MNPCDPEYWFLTDDRVIRSPKFTSGNLVEPLVDGAAFMSHLRENLARIGSGDYFFMTAWRASPGMPLDPAIAPLRGFSQELEDALSRGADVKAILWRPPLLSLTRHIAEHARESHRFAAKLTADGGQVLLDRKLQKGVLSSHHQKSIILGSKEGDWAYVGGIDIAFDRWDAPSHSQPLLRPKERFCGWHDVHAAIRGPAVSQIWDNFAQRWNDQLFEGGDRQPPAGQRTRVISRPKDKTGYGHHFVQVLRTLPRRAGYAFAPQGEKSIALAYEKAIQLSRKYIYIEEQFLWPCNVIERLAEAAQRGVKIVIVVAEHTSGVLAPWFNGLRYQALSLLSNSCPENVFVYTLRPANATPTPNGLYVHSKLMIVDDAYVVLGSANLTNRSMHTDSELQIAIIDSVSVDGILGDSEGSVSEFARDLRLALWAEHLGTTDRSSILNPIDPDSGKPSGFPITNGLQSLSDGKRESVIQRHHVVPFHPHR